MSEYTKKTSCDLCGSTNDLHVHHLNSRKAFPEQVNDPSNMVTLCTECHIVYHTAWNTGFDKTTTKKDYKQFKKLFNKFYGRSQDAMDVALLLWLKEKTVRKDS